MGLIAREIEARGIPTLCLTSALSITRAVNPPRAAFVDYPLGHTAGKAAEPEVQRTIVRGALEAFASLSAPGVVDLGCVWSDDDTWKETAMRGRSDDGGTQDDRVAREPIPQYQSDEDQRLAKSALAAGGCPGCVWLEGEAP